MDSSERLHQPSSSANFSKIELSRNALNSRRASARSEPAASSHTTDSFRVPVKIAGVLPLIFALLPALVSLVIDEYAGAVLADAILLIVVGYSLWGLSEWSWSFYVDTIVCCEQSTDLFDDFTDSFKESKATTASNGSQIESKTKSIRRSEETKKHTHSKAPSKSLYLATALFISLGCPFLGAILLHLTRQHLSAGSVLVTDFNILIYLTLEILRSIHRISGFTGANSNVSKTSLISDSHLSNAAVIQLQAQLNHHLEYLEQIENHMDGIGEELSSLGRRVLRNEASVQSDIYTIYKGFEEINQDVRLLTNDLKRSRISKLGSGSAKENMRSLTSSVISEDSTVIDKTLNRTGRSETSHQRHLVKVRQFVPKTERAPTIIHRPTKREMSLEDQKSGLIRNLLLSLIYLALWPYKQGLKLMILPLKIIWKFIRVKS